MLEAIKQYVLAGVTIEQIEALTVEDAGELAGDETIIITRPRLANIKRYALSVYEQDRREQVKQGFEAQFGGLRAWLGDTWPDCEFEVAEELGKLCVKIYPEGK